MSYSSCMSRLGWMLNKSDSDEEKLKDRRLTPPVVTPGGYRNERIRYPNRPNPGDHIAAYRDLTGAIFHHGIYVYDDYVIEMTDRGVGCKSYPDFKNGCWVYRVYDNQSLAPKIIVNRAVNALNLESKPYHLFKNNCEHFATKIATRFAQSKQAQAGMVYQHPPMGPDEYDDNLTHAPTQQNASMLTQSR